MWSSLITEICFYAIAAITIIFSIMVVSLKNIFHSALSLIVALLGVAAIYIYLEAEFLALVQILIYVGAIVTLIIFAIMLTAKISDKSLKQSNEQKLLSFIIALAAAIILAFVFLQFNNTRIVLSGFTNLSDIGQELLIKYLLPFEVISVILLAALIGAMVVSRKD